MDQIKQSFEKIKNKALSQGAEVELLISGGDSLKLGFQKRQLEKFESTQSMMAGVRVVIGSKQGISYTENLNEESLLRTFNDAFENAKMMEADKELQEIPLAGPSSAASKNFDELFQNEKIEMSDKKEVARKFEALALDADARVQAVPYNGLAESTSYRRILNSKGLDKEFKQKYWTGYSYVLAKDGSSSKMQGEGIVARSFAELKPEVVVKKAVTKATSLLGAEKLATGRYPVVIDRDCMSSFLTMLESYFSAKSVHEKTSLLAGKLGQVVAHPEFELIDDPLFMDGLAVRPFDSEGATSKVTPLIGEGGRLLNYLTNLEFAYKMKLPHTAHAVRSPNSGMDIGASNLIVKKGSATFEKMVKSAPQVLHITHIAGGLHAGFKSSTGDFSLPCEGFLYENGVKVKAVDQFVLSGNILQLIKEIQMIGNEWQDKGSTMYCPDLLIKELSVAGA